MAVRAWHCIAWILVVAACSPSVETEPQEEISEERFAERYSEAYCDASTCCAELGYDTIPDCNERVRARIQPAMDRAHEAGATFDASAAERCIEAVRSQLLGCRIVKPAATSFPSECLSIYANKTLAAGQPCTSLWDCADEGAQVGACGDTCGLLSFVGEGAACDGFEVLCTAGVCVNGTCFREALAGEECPSAPIDGDLCEPGFTCDRSGTQRCVEATPVGEPCPNPERCEGFYCPSGRGVCGWPGALSFQDACVPP